MAAMKGDDGIADSKDPIERVSSRTQAVVAWFSPTDLVNWSIPKGYAMIEITRPGFFKKYLEKSLTLSRSCAASRQSTLSLKTRRRC